MKTLAAFLSATIFFCASLFAQPNNPVPFVNHPLIPASIAPGGPGFTLNVVGTGFVSGSTVHWNGSPRATTFVSNSHLTASISSSDITTATTASITVSSPAPGGGTSNIVFLPVREPSTFVSLNASSLSVQGDLCSVASGDFNNDGNQDLAACLINPQNGQYTLSILLGNGNGNFTQGAQYSVLADNTVVADVNGDGNLDLVFDTTSPNNDQALGVMLGAGDGTFQPVTYYQGSVCCETAVGDFNHDGLLDVVTAYSDKFCILLGAGGGTFQTAHCYGLPLSGFDWLAVGDFNRDGALDLAFASESGGFAIALGNGDGTFETPVFYPVGGGVNSIDTADLNGDGKLDLVMTDLNTGRVVISYGNGDRTFRAGFTYATPFEPFSALIADMNGDGKLDLITGDYGYGIATGSILLGNGDGTFQPFMDYGGGFTNYFAIADFNNDGMLDLAMIGSSNNNITIMSQDNGTTAALAPKTLTFPTQLVNTVSNPKVVTLTNTGSSAITVSNISVSPNFSELTNCGAIQPGKICEIGVFFTPTTPGNILGYMSVTDNAGGSPQVLNFYGTGTIVLLSPSSLNFGNVPVGTLSAPQTVMVSNKGNGSVNIEGVGIGGANGGNFMQVNACPQQLPAGTSCNITVYFRPSATGVRNGILGVADTGGGSPQTIPLTGTGT